MNTTRTILSTAAAVFFAATLPHLSFAKSQDIALWTVNMAKSKLGPTDNRLVIVPAQGKATPGQRSSASFLVIANGKIYLATDENAAAGGVIRTVDYSRWSRMKLLEIGNHVQSDAYCGFRCQHGLTDPRGITLSFKSKGYDMAQAMKTGVLVLNSH